MACERYAPATPFLSSSQPACLHAVVCISLHLVVEVLLLIWGVFFIATLDTTPEQKARNFDKHIKKGKRSMRVKGSGGGEEQPNWNIAHGGPLQDTGSSNGGTVSAN